MGKVPRCWSSLVFTKVLGPSSQEILTDYDSPQSTEVPKMYGQFPAPILGLIDVIYTM